MTKNWNGIIRGKSVSYISKQLLWVFGRVSMQDLNLSVAMW